VSCTGCASLVLPALLGANIFSKEAISMFNHDIKYAQKTYYSLTTLFGNVLQSIQYFSSVNKVNHAFTCLIEDRGIEVCDADFENGYFEFENGTTICMTSFDQNDIDAEYYAPSRLYE
jgi:hypothetical protein